MNRAYALQAYYRSVGHRETEPSYLVGMFTEGYPVRDKIEAFLTFIWGDVDEMTPELQAYHAGRETLEETGAPDGQDEEIDLDSDPGMLFTPWRESETQS